MKFFHFQLYITLLILAVIAHKGIGTYNYKYLGGWQEFGSNTEADLDRGLNRFYDIALNYAHADFLYIAFGTFNQSYNEESCNQSCIKYAPFCTSYQVGPIGDPVQFNCVIYNNEKVFANVYVLNQDYIPQSSHCAEACDNYTHCNLYEFWTGDAEFGPQCILFYAHPNATIEQTIPLIDDSCGINCQDAWFARGSMCRSISKDISEAFCKSYCKYDDKNNKDLCTDVKNPMKEVCECNNVSYGPEYCFSILEGVSDEQCQPYCHIKNQSCKVDQAMKDVCVCTL